MTGPCPDCHAARALCDDCRATLTARAALTPRDQARDVEAFMASWTAALAMVAEHLRERTKQAEQDARDAYTRAQARELDLLLVALRTDAPVPPLASPGLDAVRQLWARSATYVPPLSRRERWALLCEALPEAARLAVGVKG